MNVRKFIWFAGAAIALVLLACSFGGYTIAPKQQPQPDDGGGPSGGQPSPTSVVVAPPTAAIDVPPPNPGTGNVVGRVLWNIQPVVGTEVKLCEEFGRFSGCEGVSFSTSTDENGYFVFANIQPGEYALAVHGIDANIWHFTTEEFGINAKKYLVVADQTIQVGDQHIHKFDLSLIYPKDDDRISEPQPTLQWDAYPDAAYYEVYLRPDHGETIFSSERVTTNEITPSSPLPTCEYRWQVEAFNAQGIEIAENARYFYFYVTDQALSCYVTLTSPQDDATVASGEGVTLTWEAYPGADYYKVYVAVSLGDMIVSFPKVSGTSYVIPQTLASGEYVWSVDAYDKFGNEIAGSDLIYFNVP